MDILSIAEHVGVQKSRLDVLKADPNIDTHSVRRAEYVIQTGRTERAAKYSLADGRKKQ